MSHPVISADSHITEHPSTYADYIDAKWRDKAPQLRDCGEKGDLFFIDGIKTPVLMGLVAAAGKPSSELRMTGVRFDELHRSGWDPTTRREDQIRDGDYVVVERRSEARNGETVVALIRGCDATLKRFFRMGSQVRLEPANASMKPVEVPASDVEIRGVVCGLLRRYSC